ncbi:hypothetical protein EI94DRAFT_1709707 [Lactarius quietus]|nr:hypothetical protein EI94DRAFT_1709707 [Lactarius quietus]
MDPPLNTSSLWRHLSVREIVGLLPPSTFSSKERKKCAKLDNAVLQLPADQRALLEQAAIAKLYNSTQSQATNSIDATLSLPNTHEEEFLETVSEDCRHEHISMFIDMTGNTATAMGTCAVCTGNFFLQELYKEKTPALPLANGMWIGDIPLELKVLTLPERILVAHFFPAVYIVKLYPKKRGARNWGMFPHIVSVQIKLHISPVAISCPRAPPFLLQLLESLSLVPRTFLKKLCLVFYESIERTNITISHDRLNALPVDSVPEEIISLIKFSDDTKLLAEEHDGYVPPEYGEEIYELYEIEDPDVIPLQSLGVVDVAANDIHESEILAHALANVSHSDRAEGWAIK